MPERPDLEYVVPILRGALIGRVLATPRVRKPVVLRALAAELVGPVHAVERRGHTVVLGVGDRELIVSPMLAGRFQLVAPGTKDPTDLALAWPVTGGAGEPVELRYRDDVQMGKVYWVPRGELPTGVPAVGVDVLGPAFTVQTLASILKPRREQVKIVLMDKSALDAMGNAYADEVLWHAGVHPKLPAYKLTQDQVASLHAAIIQVLGHARDEIRLRAPPLDEKVRDFLHVRGRVGPCDHCGTKLRTLGVRGHGAYFCPNCQSEGAKVGIVDWRKAR